MSEFSELFSGHAGLYQRARPTYPESMLDWLASVAPSTTLAWDAGCGNGQLTRGLASRFARVVGTDPSAPQIANAVPAPGVEYRVEPAEECSLESGSAGLATVAQALHWFDLDRYFAQVRRVLVPGGVFAAVVYTHFRVDERVDAVRDRLYGEVLGPYWPGDRAFVESGYRTLTFPFEELTPPPFELVVAWDLPAVIAYCRSWSSSQRYLAATGADPIKVVEDDLRAAWGDPAEVRELRWDITVRAGRVS